MRTRPIKKEVNYDEDRLVSSTGSEQDMNDEFEEEVEVDAKLQRKALASVRVIKNNLQPVRRRGRKPKNIIG